MAGNKTLELSIKIAGKVDKSLINAINAAQSNVSSLSATLSKTGTVGLAAMGTMATGTVAALAKCTDAAKAFEGQMGDVVKYVSGLADANGKISDLPAGNGATYAENYAAMSDAILDLSTQIPMTAEELTQLAAAAGQSGKGISDLVKRDAAGNISGFLKDVAMMGTAMDISADQAGDWAAKWEQAFKMDHGEIMVLADQINYLGANSATTAAEIAAAVNSAASLGQIGGISVSTTAALADAMLATGVSSDRVGTSIKRMVTNFSKGSSATKQQKELWEELGFTAEGVAASMQKDSVGTLNSIFNAIKNLPEERQVSALSTLFGQWAIEGGAKIVNNLDVYQKALDMVSDPKKYTGSMEREFIIKASTSESIDSMMANAFQAMKIDVGTAFLPAKKEISVAMIDFMNQLRSMPELGEIAQQMATLFSQGVSGAAEALKNATPAIQRLLDYLVNNGPQVLSMLGKLAAAFTAMKFAPGIESLLRGAGGLVLGSKTGGTTHTGSGGIAGMLGGLFKGGQNLAGKAPGAVSGALNTAKGILGTARVDAQLSGKSLLGTLFSGGKTLLGQTKPASGVSNYLGGVVSSLKNLGSTKIGAGVTGGIGVIREILSGISDATGLTGAAKGVTGAVRGGAGWVAGKAGGLAQGAMGLVGRVAGSAPVQAIGGALGNVGSFMGAGAGALGSIWGPMASGFGALASGALPIVGVISSIIAVVSILGDHLEDIRGIVGNVFGDAGLAVFDTFIGALQNVGTFITGLFQDGGVAQAVAPLRDAIAGIFGPEATAAFDGLVQIIQSVMGVVGQVVTFANTTVKPIIQDIFGFITQTVVPVILQTFTAAAPMISGIISNLGTAVMTVAQIIGTAIQAVMPIVQGLISAFMSIASVVVPAVMAAWETFSGGILTIVQGIQTTFQGLLDFITGVFTGNWSLAWQGVQDIFKGAFEALGGLIKTPINAVISIINQAISGINGLGLDIPDWVPVIGGKKFSISIPQIPMLAKGGFTTGPSIAGEAGTEAVISFQRSARANNIATWAKAGQMLGVQNQPVRLESFDGNGGGLPGTGGGMPGITYAPTIVIQGNANREDVDAALRESETRFAEWMEENFERYYNRMEREQSRKAY